MSVSEVRGRSNKKGWELEEATTPVLVSFDAEIRTPGPVVRNPPPKSCR